MATNEALLAVIAKRIQRLGQQIGSIELSAVNGSIAWRFSGSEWHPIVEIDTLRGRNGSDGQDGKQGERGPKGIDGKDGLDGKNGKDGRDGINGKRGDKGPRGEKGERGKDGKHGRNGVDGKDGADGQPGANGRDGVDGKDGEAPKHQWRGTRLQFQNPDGSWGKSVDLAGVSIGGGMPRSEVIQLVESIESGGSNARVVHVTDIDYTITPDVDTVACTESLTVTLPATSSKRLTIKNYGTDDVTIVTPGSQKVERNSDLTLNVDLFSVDLEQLPNGDWMVV
ncbi:MAG: hypothetical protein CMN85_10560 [Spongiibacteraceae bacterium]|nr:hypothetical protein [Spongiibacteraceae bacterium]|tara:strand:+ start:12159 stop:13004 length:846 start_codon:yes stop_codon:yes gene_type:complete